MIITYDPIKNQRSIELRNLSFDDAILLDWDNAVIFEDTRADYKEKRLVALSALNGRIHSICFKDTHNGIRVISFRKANPREIKTYEQHNPTSK